MTSACRRSVRGDRGTLTPRHEVVRVSRGGLAGRPASPSGGAATPGAAPCAEKFARERARSIVSVGRCACKPIRELGLERQGEGFVRHQRRHGRRVERLDRLAKRGQFPLPEAGRERGPALSEPRHDDGPVIDGKDDAAAAPTTWSEHELMSVLAKLAGGLVCRGRIPLAIPPHAQPPAAGSVVPTVAAHWYKGRIAGLLELAPEEIRQGAFVDRLIRHKHQASLRLDASGRVTGRFSAPSTSSEVAAK